MKKPIEHIDSNGNEFVLTPYEYTKGAHACTGCVAAGVDSWCKRMPICNPESTKGQGRHVWMWKGCSK